MAPARAPWNISALEKQFRSDIEGLRAVAVLSVVIFHFGVGALSGGFVGVDVFFVISGYLISGLLLQELERSGSIDLWRFYGRRARRLLPVALLVMSMTLLVGLFVLAPAEQLFAAKGALASSLYASNFYFMTLLADYFAPESALNPFLHTWSLSVEEQFYLAWPTLLLVLWRCRPTVRAVASAMSTLTVLSFFLCLWLSYRKQDWAFYASPTRAWEFGVGALAVLRPVTDWARRSRAAVPLGWAGVAVLCATFLMVTEDMRFPGWIAVVPVLATAAILISGASGRSGGPAGLLELPLFQWLGQHSYSIYLWHWPIVVYASILGINDPMTKIISCSVLTLICATAGFRLLESPVRASAWLAAQPLRSVTLGLSLTVLGSLIAMGLSQAARTYSTHPLQAELIHAIKQQPTASGSGRNCLIGFVDVEPVKCFFGAGAAARTIVLFGDSHADQWSTPLAQLATEQGWQLVTLLKASCPVADIADYNVRLRRHWPECTKWRKQALAEIRRLQPDLVVVSQFSSGYIRGPWTARGQHAVTYEEWANGLNSSLSHLRAANIPVLLLRDSPTPGKNIGNCIARARWQGLPEENCDTSRPNALDAKISPLESAIAGSMGMRFADLSAEFCDNAVCPGARSGLLVYRDENHITTAFAARLMPALRELLVGSQMSQAVSKR
ncbi:acyltransferase family protein [Steroidobacter flavus]|uniref:Acyltransferase family protein n=1 Tax=Steroidobacter flavus TaxID=1842136 RepID=A0ABV8T2A6_9GAMM